MAITIGSRGFSRALRALLTLGALAAVIGFPAAAHAKKQKKLQMDPTVEQPAAPAGPVPPEADANGHVNYGNPQAEGLGRVTVKAKNGDKIQVYLEGRYFGDAPITIYSVPKGDYIVEGTIVGSGKQVSSPVSVSENEEATVELGGAKADAPVADANAGATGGGWSSLSPTRQKLVYAGLAASAVGLIGTALFAVLENSAENDYEAAAPGNQANLDSISARGKRDATLTDVGLVVLAAGIGTTVIAGYPIFFHSSEKAPEAAPTTAFLTPVLGRSTAGAAFSMRF